MHSKTVYGCSRYLDGIAEQYDIHIIWVPGYNGIPSTFRADDHEFSNLDIPMRTCKLITDKALIDSVNARCAASDQRRKRRMSLTCWIHARLFAKGEGSTWVLTTLMIWRNCQGLILAA